jgi:hypothetical protein
MVAQLHLETCSEVPACRTSHAVHAHGVGGREAQYCEQDYGTAVPMFSHCTRTKSSGHLTMLALLEGLYACD